MSNQNYKLVKRVLIIIMVANFLVALAKIVIGYIVKSASVSADGFHSISDGASNIIGLIGISFAIKPEDDDHPYGHEKYETIASMFIATLLVFISYNIIVNAVKKFITPTTLTISYESLIILIVTLIINIFVATYENKAGKKYNSQFLVADSIHTKSDIFVTIGVLITLVLIKLGAPPIIDPIVSFVVALFIIHAAYEIFVDNFSVLTDKVIFSEKEVVEILKEFKVVKNVHKIRSRGYHHHVFLDMHIRIDKDLSIDEAHKLVHKIEDTFKERMGKAVDVVIHVEPYLGNDDEVEYLS